MNPAPTFVSIIIPTYKEWDLLKKCINALLVQTYPQENFEVIVVNNNPSDTKPEWLIMPPNFTLIDEIKPGSYAARNAALKIARGEIIGFTDADCVPEKNWIFNAVSYLAENPTCSRVAGNILILQKAPKPTVVEVYNRLYSFPQQSAVKYHGGCMTANLFTYRQVFESVGPFNDTFFSYGDLEWGRRANEKGYRIDFVENVIVYHPPRSFKELVKKEVRLGGGTALYRKTRPSRGRQILDFLKQFKPRTKAIRKMQHLSAELRWKDMVLIPLIRYYFGVVRSYEVLRVGFGKKPNRS